MTKSSTDNPSLLPYIHQWKDDDSIESIKYYLEFFYSIYPSRTIYTCSFGYGSGVILHIINQLDADISVVFINTGFHFPETLDYFNLNKKLYPNINFIEIKPDTDNASFLQQYGKMYEVNPHRCCYMNKINPLNKYIEENDIKVWISGARKDQTENRKSFEKIIDRGAYYSVYPLLNFPLEEMEKYIEDNKLPAHPLNNEYKSIGCAPCTFKTTCGERSGRWEKFNKTECGLHLENDNITEE